MGFLRVNRKVRTSDNEEQTAKRSAKEDNPQSVRGSNHDPVTILARAADGAISEEDIMHLQRFVGNQATIRLLSQRSQAGVQPDVTHFIQPRRETKAPQKKRFVMRRCVTSNGLPITDAASRGSINRKLPRVLNRFTVQKYAWIIVNAFEKKRDFKKVTPKAIMDENYKKGYKAYLKLTTMLGINKSVNDIKLNEMVIKIGPKLDSDLRSRLRTACKYFASGPSED